MSERAACVVDLDAVRHNVAVLREHAGDAAVMAVVKADGYGHGMLPCARAALAGGASWLGVATPQEALDLRAAGIVSPVLAWLLVPGDDLAALVRAEVDLGIGSAGLLQEAVAAAGRAGQPARVHLKVDTGLGRGGATVTDWPALLDAAARAAADGTVRLVGLWSHFAYADAPGHPTVTRQLAAFREAVDLAERRGVRADVRHLANSAATLTLPQARFDVVRPGVAVYGLSPGPEVGTPAAHGLRPAMTLTGRVALVKRVPAGQGVSYGHRYTTARETTLAVVPLGYADGVPRHGTNRLPVAIGGRRYPVAGTVCMDQFVVDVGDDEVTAGEPVVLFGPGEKGEPTAQEWAQAIDTINYEVVTRVGPRVPRVYVGGEP